MDITVVRINLYTVGRISLLLVFPYLQTMCKCIGNVECSLPKKLSLSKNFVVYDYSYFCLEN